MNHHQSLRRKLHLEPLEERCTPGTVLAPYRGAANFLGWEGGVASYDFNTDSADHVRVIAQEDTALERTSWNHSGAGGSAQALAATGTSNQAVVARTGGADFSGVVTFGRQGPQGSLLTAPMDSRGHSHIVPFFVDGSGTAPDGIPVFAGGTAPHNASGFSTLTGNYTGNQGLFQVITIDLTALTGTFHGSFVFVDARGNQLATNYGADPSNPGTFRVVPQANGTVVAEFLAVFTPVPAQSTGPYTRVVGGGWLMYAQTQPFALTVNAQGYTPPFAYSWVGAGALVIHS